MIPEQLKEQETPNQSWPGATFAYEFVIPSYQWMLSRIEAINSRNQTLQGFIATVTLGIPAIASKTFGAMRFDSWLLLSAWILAAVAVSLGLVTRAGGSVDIADPRVLYEKWLHKGEWEFKKDMVYFAGQAFGHNVRLANRKGTLVTVMTFLFTGEIILLALWILLARS